MNIHQIVKMHLMLQDKNRKLQDSAIDEDHDQVYTKDEERKVSSQHPSHKHLRNNNSTQLNGIKNFIIL